ncbi:hypothetical protein K8353_33755 [Burkholderia contaminans]|nr:hypothetical protein [Burkholderia contaminans]
MREAGHSSHECRPIHKINFSAVHVPAMLAVTNPREKSHRPPAMASPHGIPALDHGNPYAVAPRLRAVALVPLNPMPRLVNGA